MIQLKKVYEPAGKLDGKRFLIERLWPRGMKRDKLQMAAWIRDAGPSRQLRVWFHHDPAKWNEFRRRYFAELASKQQVWQPIIQAASQGTVTLLYSSHDNQHNNAVVLKQYLESRMTSGESRKAHAQEA